MIKVSIQEEFDFYLKTIGLKKETMHEVQYQQTKFAFFFSWGKCLEVQRDKVCKLEKNEAVKLLEAQEKEVIEYFFKESNQQN